MHCQQHLTVSVHVSSWIRQADDLRQETGERRCCQMLPTQIQVRPLMLTCAFTIYVQKKQSAQIDVTTQQLGEPRPAFNNGIQRKAVEPERVSRAASSTRTTKPARFAGLLC
jgi:hypothetical protein